jgi:GAF domain-containing protein
MLVIDDESESSVSGAESVGSGRGTADSGHGSARQATTEQSRLDALHGYGILDSEPERRFDDIAKLAATALDMPIAMVSLVDDKRQWSMAAIGIPRGEVPRAHSFCTHAITQDWTLVIDDASVDARVNATSYVSGPTQARFYAGAPLITPEGHRVGTVCVIDRTPRSLARRELEMLAGIARQTIELLEHRLTAARLGAAQARLQTMATLIPICSHCRKVRDEANQWLTLERLVQAKTGSRFTHGICPDCVREHYPAAADELLRNS